MVNIHKSADVQSRNIGQGTQVWQFCVILEKAHIGTNCNINCHVFIENDVVIGNNVTIKPGVQIWDRMRIEDDVFIGPNATFTNDLIPRSKHYPVEFSKTTIEKGASIGANATLLPGIKIGKYAMVGAGSLVYKDVENNSVVIGNPAKKIGYITKDGIRLSLGLQDKMGNIYHWVVGQLVVR